MQWYKGKNYILITLKNEKQKHVLHLWCQILYSDIYIYTHNALECENSGPIWGEMTLKILCLKIKTNAHEYEIDTTDG